MTIGIVHVSKATFAAGGERKARVNHTVLTVAEDEMWYRNRKRLDILMQ